MSSVVETRFSTALEANGWIDPLTIAPIRHAPDPHHEGWWTWDLPDDSRYNATLGKLVVRPEGPGKARVRIWPERRQSNIADVVHGGAIMTLIDMALFAGGSMAGLGDVAFAVTLDCQVQFIAPARLGLALDAAVELIKETRRLAFLRGLVEQDGITIAAFSGTLRKASERA